MDSGRTVAFVGLLAVVLVGCGGNGGGDPVRFGEGRVPDSVPDGFPVPPRAVIGATMVDTINHRTEFTVNVESDSLLLIQFYTIELVNQGFVIDRSGGLSDTTWEIVFSRNEVAGSILISSGGGGLSSAVVSLNVS